VVGGGKEEIEAGEKRHPARSVSNSIMSHRAVRHFSARGMIMSAVNLLGTSRAFDRESLREDMEGKSLSACTGSHNIVPRPSPDRPARAMNPGRAASE